MLYYSRIEALRLIRSPVWPLHSASGESEICRLFARLTALDLTTLAMSLGSGLSPVATQTSIFTRWVRWI